MANSEQWTDESKVPTRWRVEWDEMNEDGTSTPRKITFTDMMSAIRCAADLERMYGVFTTVRDLY